VVPQKSRQSREGRIFEESGALVAVANGPLTFNEIVDRVGQMNELDEVIEDLTTKKVIVSGRFSRRSTGNTFCQKI